MFGMPNYFRIKYKPNGDSELSFESSSSSLLSTPSRRVAVLVGYTSRRPNKPKRSSGSCHP